MNCENNEHEWNGTKCPDCGECWGCYNGEGQFHAWSNERSGWAIVKCPDCGDKSECYWGGKWTRNPAGP